MWHRKPRNSQLTHNNTTHRQSAKIALLSAFFGKDCREVIIQMAQQASVSTREINDEPGKSAKPKHVKLGMVAHTSYGST